LAYAGTEQHGEYIKMNFEEIRDRKLKIITTQYISLEGGSSSIQSEAFNAATKAIMIRVWSQNFAYVYFEIGLNPTASYLDFYITGAGTTSPSIPSEILTFNVEPGHKIAVQSSGSNARVHIIELG